MFQWYKTINGMELYDTLYMYNIGDDQIIIGNK